MWSVPSAPSSIEEVDLALVTQLPVTKRLGVSFQLFDTGAEDSNRVIAFGTEAMFKCFEKAVKLMPTVHFG